MDNDSATGGYLTPGSPAPADDACLARQIQQVVVGITGLEGQMVRPRWQPVPPPVPEADQDWCAVGVMAQRQDGMPALIHDGTGAGTSTLRRHSVLEILASFYGPNAEGYATLLADGLYIAQNREVMMRQGLALIDVDPARNMSDIQNTIWRRKVDLPFRLRRRVDRVYAIRNVAGAHGTIHYDGGAISGPLTADVPFSVQGQS